MSDPRQPHSAGMRSPSRSAPGSAATASSVATGSYASSTSRHHNPHTNPYHSHNSSTSSIGTSWMHAHNLSETPDHLTGYLHHNSRQAPGSTTADQGPPPSRHQEAVAAGHRLDIHMEHLQEDLQHERVTKNQKSKLHQKNLESLRGLVAEIQADEWQYTEDGSDALMASYFTRMDAWGSK